MPETHVIDVASPLLGQSSKPGQFVHIRCAPMWDPLLRRPMSIFRIRPEGVSIMVRAVGDGSQIIAASAVGAEARRARAARARRSPSTRQRGGWRWSAAATAWRRWWRWRPRHSGAAARSRCWSARPRRTMSSRPTSCRPEVEYGVATVDGSLGHHGLVTELLPRYLDWSDAVYACGPTPMLEAVARLTRPASFGVAGAIRSRKPVQLVDGAAHGLRDGRLPGLRGDDPQGVSAGLPRRPGLPGRRDDLGGQAMPENGNERPPRKAASVGRRSRA